MSLRLRVLAGFFPLALAAQSVHIEGTIVDAGSGIPIGGAKAVLRHATSPGALDTATTEASGTFQLSAKEPGRYTVEVSAPGFEETVYRGTGNAIEFNAAQFEAAAGDTIRNIVVKIARSGGPRGIISRCWHS